MTLYCLNGQVYIAIVMDHDTEAGPGDFYAMGVAKELCDAFEEEYKELTIEVNRLEAVQLGQAAIESRL